MSIVTKVQQVWKRLSKSMHRFLNNEALRGAEAGWRMRCKIIRNLVRGESPTRMQAILGCARSHIYTVAARFLDEGVEGLADRREGNGNTKVDEHYMAFIVTAVAGAPPEYGYQRPTWTQELLILVAGKQTSVVVSTSTMSRLLSRLGARQGRPKPCVACPWPKAQKTRRLNEIRRLVERRPRNTAVLYVDEVDIHLNPKIGDDWMLRGQQKQVLTPGQNVKHYLAGALDAHTGRVEWVDGPRKNSLLFIGLVDRLLTRATFRGRTLHLVLDNFRIHSSRAVETAQFRWGNRVVLHFLPPYCPDDNRIERLWKDLHDNVTRNHTCQSMEQLITRVYDYLRQRRHGQHQYLTAA